MARYGPEHPPWLVGAPLVEAEPLDKPFDLTAPERYLMACSVAGRKDIFVVHWRGLDINDAEATFVAWLNQGWAVMSKTFRGEPCRYVFRTHAIQAFFVMPASRR